MFKVMSLLTSKEQQARPSGWISRPKLQVFAGGSEQAARPSSAASSSSLLLIADVLAEFGEISDVSETLGSRPLTELAANDPPRRARAS